MCSNKRRAENIVCLERGVSESKVEMGFWKLLVNLSFIFQVASLEPDSREALGACYWGI